MASRGMWAGGNQDDESESRGQKHLGNAADYYYPSQLPQVAEGDLHTDGKQQEDDAELCERLNGVEVLDKAQRVGPHS